ncbi:MAG: DUF4337 family protein [Acidobacteriia bacterium]|nr:DUF4337 family protein [Terriglobia bacterium]
MTSTKEPKYVQEKPLSRPARAALALEVLCCLLALFTVLGSFYFNQKVQTLAALIEQKTVAAETGSAVQHIYKIQKDQLELRLNELAIDEKSDEDVLGNYKMRIAQYGTDVDRLAAEHQQAEAEIAALETRHLNALRRYQWLLGATAAFLMSILLTAWNLQTGRASVLAAALSLSVIALTLTMNGLLLVVKLK